MEIRSLFRSLIWSGRISDYYIYLQIIQNNEDEGSKKDLHSGWYNTKSKKLKAFEFNVFVRINAVTKIIFTL